MVSVVAGANALALVLLDVQGVMTVVQHWGFDLRLRCLHPQLFFHVHACTQELLLPFCF